MKRFILALAGAAMVAGVLVAPQSAQAAEQFTVVFTAGANVTTDVYFPGLDSRDPLGKADGTYTFDTTIAGIGGQKLCIATSSAHGTDTSCELKSVGSFGAMLGASGASCLHSTGRGDVPRVIINGTNVALNRNVKVEWPAAAGTVLPFTLSTSKFATQGGAVIGQGAVQVTGAAPGQCGLGGPTNKFEVTGYAVASL